MGSIVLLIVCFALGVLVARLGKPARVFAQSLNWWVINVALTALVLQLVPTIDMQLDLWFLAASMWFVFIGAWLFCSFVGRLLDWTRGRIGALTLVCGLGNTAFVGFPLIEALRGREGLKLALVADQTGCFLALAVGGTIVAAVYSGKSVTAGDIARKVLLFPPFVALIAGVTVGALGAWPPFVDEVLGRIGATLVPLALFSVGLQFHLHVDRRQLQAMVAGLAWKLLLAPLLVFGAGAALRVEGELLAVSVLESAMGPMVSAAILASEHNLDDELANAVLGIGILLSFATVPIANWLLG
ncbi:MAG TPA: AEC family transporter [Steroidobacteraceae bacterium]